MKKMHKKAGENMLKIAKKQTASAVRFLPLHFQCSLNRTLDYLSLNSLGVYRCLGIPSTITGDTSPWINGLT